MNEHCCVHIRSLDLSTSSLDARSHIRPADLSTSSLDARSHTRAFTIIETIVAIAIFLVIGGAVVVFQQSVLRNTKVLQNQLNSEQQVRRTLTSFVAELRSASPSAAGAYAIEAAATSSIIFYSNIDADTSIERVRYFFSTSTSPIVFDVLKKGIIKPTGTVYNAANEKISVMVHDMKNSSTTPIFSYYDTNYTGTSSPLSVPINIPLVRLVKMQLVVDPNVGRSPVVQTFTTQVSIRNLKDNL